MTPEIPDLTHLCNNRMWDFLTRFLFHYSEVCFLALRGNKDYALVNGKP